VSAATVASPGEEIWQPKGNPWIIAVAVSLAASPGASTLSIVQVNARDSQQRPIQLVTSEAGVQVKP
jgi:hypothetical protein